MLNPTRPRLLMGCGEPLCGILRRLRLLAPASAERCAPDTRSASGRGLMA